MSSSLLFRILYSCRLVLWSLSCVRGIQRNRQQKRNDLNNKGEDTQVNNDRTSLNI